MDNARGHYQVEWGGLYLRSEPELRIAQALDATGILFFANSRGRFGLCDAPISNSQLSGRVEADFLLMTGGRCLVLEADGLHLDTPTAKARGILGSARRLAQAGLLQPA